MICSASRPRNRGDWNFRCPLGSDTSPKPPHAPRNRGDWNKRSWKWTMLIWLRLTPPESRRLEPNEAARTNARGSPPHAPRNRGDWNVTGWDTVFAQEAASRPRNRGDWNIQRRRIGGVADPPHAPRNRGDWNFSTALIQPLLSARLTPPGIAATGTSRPVWPAVTLRPPHAPRNRGDWNLCGQVVRPLITFRLTPPGIAATGTSRRRSRRSGTKAASRPPESRRLEPVATAGVRAQDRRLTPPESRRLELLAALRPHEFMIRLTPPESRRLELD